MSYLISRKNFMHENIVTYLKYLVKHIIWFFKTHAMSDMTDIFLFTSRRSGGTWFTEIISGEDGVRYIIEPFCTALKDPFIKNHYYEGFDGKGLDREKDILWLQKFSQLIISGKLKIQESWNPFSPLFHLRTNRVCMKIHDAKIAIDWFAINYPKDKMLYFLRHPIPQAISSIKCNSSILIEAYLNNNWLRKFFIHKELLTFCNKILKEGSLIEKYVTSWCLENLVPLRHIDDDIYFTLTYEELVVNKELVIELVFNNLEIKPPKAFV